MHSYLLQTNNLKKCINSNYCSGRVLSKNWRLCAVIAASACKNYLSCRQSHANCTRVATIKLTVLCLRLAAKWVQFACDWRPRGYNLHATGGHVSTICMRLAATWVQFACDWRPRGYNLHATGGHVGTIFMRLAATWVQFACDWRPRGYNLHATGGHSGTICLQLATRRTLFLYRLAASPISSSSSSAVRWRYFQHIKVKSCPLLKNRK
jgi:hypothetical protein